jgi:hypothetical protein
MTDKVSSTAPKTRQGSAVLAHQAVLRAATHKRIREAEEQAHFGSGYVREAQLPCRLTAVWDAGHGPAGHG